MKAWSCSRYGSPAVLRLRECPDPVPRRGELVVRVVAASVSAGDARVRGCRFPKGMRLAGRLALGWNRPRQAVLGTDCAGVVETVGAGVRFLQAGDAVLVVKGAAMGCHAEKVRVKSGDVFLRKPEALGWAEAVSLPFGGQTARYFLTKAGLRRNQEVLVIGAAGAVGSAAVQLIHRAGARATAVTRACNADWIRKLGAVDAIDYTTTDYHLQTQRFDIVMDCVGAGTFRTMRHLAKPGGAYLAVAGGMPEMLTRGAGGVRCVTGFTPESTTAVRELLDLAMAGEFQPVVGARYPFDELPSAHALVDTGRKRGTVVIDFDKI